VSADRLKVVLLWHMHQPDYRDAISGDYQQPWTYLHGIKDYVDMAALLEANPAARAVVNFSPTLLEQLGDYAEQIRDYHKRQTPLRDPLLAALISDFSDVSASYKLDLVRWCLRANAKRMINRFPAFHHLSNLATQMLKTPDLAHYFSDQFLADLLVWYHLAWLGETVRLHEPRVKALLQKTSRYTMGDRQELLDIVGELLGGTLARYRFLAEEGRVELSITPYGHPIMPLLLDMNTTHQAMPEAPLPGNALYPGGENRVRWHIKEGLRVFETHFGFRPAGCWPSEGALSTETLKLLAESGFSWTASGESVMRNSMHSSGVDTGGCTHHPFKVEGAPITCFFRDDGLSDLIGFTYADWHSRDAVNNLLHHLQNIATACVDEPNRVVSIILDGENAWEYYPENGYHFLNTLYTRLSEHPEIELTTFSQCLEQGVEAQSLQQLVAGSWVYGTFSTWIGSKDKNRGWELLVEAKQVFDRVIAEGRLNEEQTLLAERQLGICEASDWFWWFGDYNPSESVQEFEQLYRHQLQALYECLGEPPPDALDAVISQGGGEVEAGGVMRRGQEQHG
jgi:alpha-amylase/alpha-mannosidase (GH57 family)